MKTVVYTIVLSMALMMLPACGTVQEVVSVPESIASASVAESTANADNEQVEIPEELIRNCLERLFDCATLPEGTTITEEWLAQTFPECTDTTRQKCIYEKGIAAVLLFPQVIGATECRYTPDNITVEPDGDGSYAYQADLAVTNGTVEQVTLTGRVQTDDAGMISYISFDKVLSDGEMLMAGMLDVYGPIAPPLEGAAVVQ